jgi:hypothetical protein
MSTPQKNNLANFFTVLVLILTAFQGLIPTMPIMNPGTITLISAITMFLVSGLTTWKQFISTEINNKAMNPTIIVTVVAVIGSLNDLTQAIPMGETAAQWVRFGITFVVMCLNIVSKIYWPTEQTKSSI